LEGDVLREWLKAGLPQPCPVHVCTLHSLALRLLRAAGQLSAFAVPPRVLDELEMEDIFGLEFGVFSGVTSRTRRLKIQVDHEAFWSTGEWLPPGFPVPNPPVTEQERKALSAYYRSRSSLYCCLLPADITRRCLEYFSAMPIDWELPVQIAHLIVDEYQDLNPVDLKLISEIRQRGTDLFVAGDDDQSIYFFRYAMPAGIQQFEAKYPGSVSHTLRHCFRCPKEILSPAQALLAEYPGDSRIPKAFIATASLAEPPLVGSLHRWCFRGWRGEADAIAASCADLIREGIPADEIAILLSNRPALEQNIVKSLKATTVPYELADEDRFADEPAGRAATALIRLVVDPSDYVAVRVIVGLQTRVGPTTCNEIAAWAIANGLRYADAFTRTDCTALGPRARHALERTSNVRVRLAGLSSETPVAQASELIAACTEAILGAGAAAGWRNYVADLPNGMTLQETCKLLTAPTTRASRVILDEVRDRLGLAAAVCAPCGVRLMTLHGSKGLTFEAVFIPGLEQGLLPNQWDMPFPGLVEQAARVLYVGMTRARLMLVLSMAEYRMIEGELEARQPTTFVGNLSGRFQTRKGGLNRGELAAVLAARRVALAD
jgi:DNA helicase-2/ATP-dependent DNA helicase PcrA